MPAAENRRAARDFRALRAAQRLQSSSWEVTIMFKIITLLTALALGSSASVAMASPSQRVDRYSTFDRDRFDRDRFDRREWRGSYRSHDDFGPRRYRASWEALGRPLGLTRAGRASIDVDDPGTFTQLRLADLGGTARIDRVIIEFADGSHQVEEVRRVLDDNSDFVEIALDGNNRRVDAITVIGRSSARRNLQVYGI